MTRARKTSSGKVTLRVLLAALTALVATAAAAAAANADIFAASDSVTAGQRDIALVNVNTGARVTLPAGVNTADADEVRPTITADGEKLVFMRTGGGATRIIMVDLSSGQTSDLFNGFQAAAQPPLSPFITPDGKTVLTGRRFQQESSTCFRPVVTFTDVSNFPTGPYPHTDHSPLSPCFTPQPDGAVNDVSATGSASGSAVAFREDRQSSGDALDLAVVQPTGSLGGSVRVDSFHSAHPALGSPGGSPTIAWDTHTTGDNGDIVFRPANLGSTGFAGTPTPLPPVVNTTDHDESRPAFTSDGRYLAFVRVLFVQPPPGGVVSSAHNFLFVWDSATQTIVNPSGVDLGLRTTSDFDYGSPSLYVRPIVLASLVRPTGLVTFNLAGAAGVGILVQRVVGHHKLFGRTVPTLRTVGPVPLGQFRKGRGKARWNFRVHGKRLRRGTYQVTARALTRRGKVRDFGKPKIIRLRR